MQIRWTIFGNSDLRDLFSIAASRLGILGKSLAAAAAALEVRVLHLLPGFLERARSCGPPPAEVSEVGPDGPARPARAALFAAAAGDLREAAPAYSVTQGAALERAPQQ